MTRTTPYSPNRQPRDHRFARSCAGGNRRAERRRAEDDQFDSFKLFVEARTVTTSDDSPRRSGPKPANECAAEGQEGAARARLRLEAVTIHQALPEGDISLKLMANHWGLPISGRFEIRDGGMARAKLSQVRIFPQAVAVKISVSS